MTKKNVRRFSQSFVEQMRFRLNHLFVFFFIHSNKLKFETKFDIYCFKVQYFRFLID